MPSTEWLRVCHDMRVQLNFLDLKVNPIRKRILKSKIFMRKIGSNWTFFYFEMKKVFEEKSYKLFFEMKKIFEENCEQFYFRNILSNSDEDYKYWMKNCKKWHEKRIAIHKSKLRLKTMNRSSTVNWQTMRVCIGAVSFDGRKGQFVD
ncbi:uncharacterized protein LOC122510722 [Leptopilina heterotoma]|uniref:uncharacterized protein LOC122510722 n=1 Tax=Leptopilina heterotoma TaxID=63436 RepID=UPI001CA9A302|nr:uncharacterized protein LOC122510722 [Leptopilina heterotoma]XP_043481493.1 uncharacterized protein LOC122510722 [Leptopilina heterotoma]XP_043481494.1 uncharacterized protein LOC122510722 [Leptopilina heterotoma]XP_043481496.1 uncharacterized protein LOC122510722 [Leptopilina heterotoma]XP_043481497.1 uncharacterized protein LOC122510722 [Leptopilina heterotoma]XP_043481498.1 uncharacterized protein LOC122510722 [Leptopilina heterotoma]